MSIAQQTYQKRQFPYIRCADQDSPEPARHPVVVVGAGPVGMTLAIDLAGQGVPVLLLDDDDTLSAGSRAICFAKRTLDIWDRLGCGQIMVDKGVSWNVGKVFFQDQPVYSFDLLPEAGHRRPAFINLQQYYAEDFLYQRLAGCRGVVIRWKNKVVGVRQDDDGVELTVETPDGPYRLRCDWLVAADGSRSPLRAQLGLESRGRVFRDRFLIADVRMKAEFPTERWFWFDPPFHPNQSVLLHRQPDNVWRIDFQLGWDADPAVEKLPENVIPRVAALLGPDAEFELEWVSVYTFACARMDSFRHGRVLFVGDSAHGVSPFGARGANSGVQDADNLAWKLKMVLDGRAPQRLLDSYCREREFAADENIRHSTRSTDFITPKSAVSRVFRDAVLKLARHHPFARQLVNSGRLSMPSVYGDSPLNTADTDTFAGAMAPGAAAADAPVRMNGADGWFLAQTGGDFCCLLFADEVPEAGTLAALRELSGVRPLLIVPAGAAAAAEAAAGIALIEDVDGLLARRYDARPGTCYLLRPDQHVCARWRRFDAAALRQALARATCNQPT